MNNNNYRFIVGDDHKGNKVMLVVRGSLTDELITNSGVVNGPAFNNVAQQLINILEHSSFDANKNVGNLAHD